MNSPCHALGIDIGGTKIAIGVVAADGRVLTSHTLSTESRRGIRDATERVTTTVRRVLQDCGLDCHTMAGVGVGCSGPVNPLSGEINNPHTLPGWEGWNIVSSLTRTLDLPVWLENDADAAGLGEYYYGSGRGADRLVMLTVGTGVGGAVILDGEIYRGVGGEHPELGHMPISFDGSACYCGRNGCLESLISGPAIADAGRPLGLTDAAAVFAAAAAADARAERVLAPVRRAVEVAAWNVLHSFLPARIVLGGGLVQAHPAFFAEAAQAAVSGSRLHPRGAATIVPAQLGNPAGMIGAARWAMVRSARLAGPPSITAPQPTCLPCPAR